jgi:hypothetical protein
VTRNLDDSDIEEICKECALDAGVIHHYPDFFATANQKP